MRQGGRNVRWPASPEGLIGRGSECKALDQLIEDVLAGTSRVIVLRGEAGIGKSALLGYLTERVAGWHIATAAGVESEMELAYSGLHQLCAPMLDDHLEPLPVPLRDALATVFGRSTGPPPDRFLVGLAALSLFAEVAEQRPLVCIVDDSQWIDQVSAQIIGFVARRLFAERIALVCAARTGIGDDVLSDLPALLIEGLGASDARAILLSNLKGPLDPAVRDQIVIESHGNPLALLELPRGMTETELAGGFGLAGAATLSARIEESFVRRLEGLPPETRSVMLVAAAEPVGDPQVLRHATEGLGIEAAAAAGKSDELLSVAPRVRFRHPLVRSTVYRAASPQERRAAHMALAEATDREIDPDRRAWHLAMAAAGPDEDVALELERSADRAQARGGVAAAAAFLQRAVALTADPDQRGERALAAAQASMQAGAFDAALGLLETAKAGRLDPFQRARVDLLRAHIAFASSLGREAPPLLLEAARRLEAFDLELARETYLVAWAAAGFAGSADDRDVLLEICRAVQALPRPDRPRPLDLLLDGLALLMTDGHVAAAVPLQRASKLLTDIPVEDVLRWGWLAYSASAAVWDVEGMRTISAREAQLARAAGALAELPLYLYALCLTMTWMGDFTGADTLIAEIHSVAAATGSSIDPSVELRLVSLRGREAEASAAIAGTIEQAKAGGQGQAASYAHWAAAVLQNGLARYAEAASSALEATSDTVFPWPAMWALPELVEAASRAGNAELARAALDRLSKTTQPCATDVSLGIEARCRALLSDGAVADDLYREAIDRLSRTRVRPDLARAHLLYGEWLRREGRRTDAREELHTAYGMFEAIGMEAFAERTRMELLATGLKVRKRDDETRDQLTPQEEQIARLARDGLSNPEIGGMLFLSRRTVEWHLHKVFAKLDIGSRRELAEALAEQDQPAAIA
jgi:DNA-binding CsgD family transcriptional regulator